MTNEGYASFEGKWLQANPEQAVVALFLPARERRVAHAFGTLVHELEQALVGVRETQVAAAKIAWWREELAGLAGGGARHPVARELLDAAAEHAAGIDWAALADGALALLEAPAPASLDAAYGQLGAFYAPVAAVDAALRGTAAGAGDADLWTSSQMLHAAILPEREAERGMALPLDLFARHGLARADLAQPGRARGRLLADFLASLGERLDAALRAAPAASVGRRVRARLDLRIAAVAAGRADPAAFLAQASIPRWRVAWLAWREARSNARGEGRA